MKKKTAKKLTAEHAETAEKKNKINSASSAVKKDVVVIGLGNILLSDEGIGVHLVRQLQKVARASSPCRHGQDGRAASAVTENVEFIDAGAAGMNLLHLIANREKAIIIDCARMGEKPGTMKRFTLDNVQSVKQLTGFSLHEVDIFQVVNLSKQLGESPAEVFFFGIEPQSLGPGQNLSKTLSDKIDVYIAAVCEELR